MTVNEPSEPHPMQKTPKGAEIPIPTRDAFLRDLAKVVPPVKPQPGQDERNKRDEA